MSKFKKLKDKVMKQRQEILEAGETLEALKGKDNVAALEAEAKKNEELLAKANKKITALEADVLGGSGTKAGDLSEKEMAAKVAELEKAVSNG